MDIKFDVEAHNFERRMVFVPLVLFHIEKLLDELGLFVNFGIINNEMKVDVRGIRPIEVADGTSENDGNWVNPLDIHKFPKVIRYVQ